MKRGGKSSLKNPLPEGLAGGLLEFEAHLKMELGRGKNTVAAYLSDISQFSQFLASRKIVNFASVSGDNLVEWIGEVAPKARASTQSRKISALKSLAKFLVDENVWKKNLCDVIARPKTRRNIPEVLTAAEVVKLLSAPDKATPLGLRDAAMFELMYGSGLRVSELCAMKESDIDFREGIIRVRGKGTKTRLVPMGDCASEAVRAYKSVRVQIIKDGICPELFVTSRGEKLSRKTFWFNIKKYADSAGIKKNVKPHILRHSFATHLLQNGANLMSIREMLGHSDLSTTQIYTSLLGEKIVSEHKNRHPRSHMDVSRDGDF